MFRVKRRGPAIRPAPPPDRPPFSPICRQPMSSKPRPRCRHLARDGTGIRIAPPAATFRAGPSNHSPAQPMSSSHRRNPLPRCLALAHDRQRVRPARRPPSPSVEPKWWNSLLQHRTGGTSGSRTALRGRVLRRSASTVRQRRRPPSGVRSSRGGVVLLQHREPGVRTSGSRTARSGVPDALHAFEARPCGRLQLQVHVVADAQRDQDRTIPGNAFAAAVRHPGAVLAGPTRTGPRAAAAGRSEFEGGLFGISAAGLLHWGSPEGYCRRSKNRAMYCICQQYSARMEVVVERGLGFGCNGRRVEADGDSRPFRPGELGDVLTRWGVGGDGGAGARVSSDTRN